MMTMVYVAETTPALSSHKSVFKVIDSNINSNIDSDMLPWFSG